MKERIKKVLDELNMNRRKEFNPRIANIDLGNKIEGIIIDDISADPENAKLSSSDLKNKILEKVIKVKNDIRYIADNAKTDKPYTLANIGQEIYALIREYYGREFNIHENVRLPNVAAEFLANGYKVEDVREIADAFKKAGVGIALTDALEFKLAVKDQKLELLVSIVMNDIHLPFIHREFILNHMHNYAEKNKDVIQELFEGGINRENIARLVNEVKRVSGELLKMYNELNRIGNDMGHPMFSYIVKQNDEKSVKSIITDFYKKNQANPSDEQIEKFINMVYERSEANAKTDSKTEGIVGIFTQCNGILKYLEPYKNNLNKIVEIYTTLDPKSISAACRKFKAEEQRQSQPNPVVERLKEKVAEKREEQGIEIQAESKGMK